MDMDSTEISVYGEQEHSAYNGHFESTCYQPRLCRSHSFRKCSTADVVGASGGVVKLRQNRGKLRRGADQICEHPIEKFVPLRQQAKQMYS